MACVFSGSVKRAREVQQPCQSQLGNARGIALINVRVKSAGMLRAKSMGALIVKA
jgi:hypothetical protein